MSLTIKCKIRIDRPIINKLYLIRISNPLKIALHNIIDNHTQISYNALWNAYQKTDKKANGKVWDMYSDIPSGTPPYQFTFVTDQCGNCNR